MTARERTADRFDRPAAIMRLPGDSWASLRPEAGVSAEKLAAASAAHPQAASILVEVLRLIERLPLKQALIAESLAYGVLQAGDDHARWLERNARSETAAAPGQIAVERRGSALSVTLQRPAAHNAIDVPMREDLREAFDLAALDASITQVTLTGAGRAFSVGADLAEFGTTRDPARAHAIRMQTLPAHALLDCKHKLLVRVQGACIGAGLEIAAFARRVEATPDAFFQLPELRMGLIPGAGGCVSVSRRIGWRRTALMVLSGRRFGARVALEWGLIDAIVDQHAADDRGTDIL